MSLWGAPVESCKHQAGARFPHQQNSDAASSRDSICYTGVPTGVCTTQGPRVLAALMLDCGGSTSDLGPAWLELRVAHRIK